LAAWGVEYDALLEEKQFVEDEKLATKPADEAGWRQLTMSSDAPDTLLTIGGQARESRNEHIPPGEVPLLEIELHGGAEG
jgi:hypothetical protein